MGKTLRNSLDLNKRKEDKIGFKVQKLEDVGLSFNQAIISITLVVFGFIVYYWIPLAFINRNFSLAIFLLMMILLTIIIGLVFLCTLLFSALEKGILWLTLHTCCRRDKKFYQVVIKNMEGHQVRNNKTALMFTLAASFLIFTQSGFSVISVMIQDLLF